MPIHALASADDEVNSNAVNKSEKKTRRRSSVVSERCVERSYLPMRAASTKLGCESNSV
jgi:hypothetical protein